MSEVDEAIKELLAVEDQFTTPAMRAYFDLLSIQDPARPSTPAAPIPQKVDVKVVEPEPQPDERGAVDVGMLMLEAWAGAAAVVSPVGVAVLASDRAIGSVHVEDDPDKLYTVRKKNSFFTVPAKRLVVWEREGTPGRLVWHVYGNFEPLNDGFDRTFGPNEPFTRVAGPVIVRMFHVREGHPDTTGDLAARRLVADRLGIALDRGPEATISGPDK